MSPIKSNYGGYDLAWFCATINSYSCILLFFQYIRFFKMLFGRARSINYITVFMYIIIILDISVGIVSMTITVNDAQVYYMDRREEYSQF